jgi:N utilization substance protein B
MGARREGREAAIQFLFQRDLHGAGDPPDPEAFWALRGDADAKARAFAEALVAGVLARLPEIDAWIRRFSTNFELGRIAAVDRNILRVAVFEMLDNPALPAAVPINEAIEIAKRFAGQDSRKFVNGVLDGIRKELSRPAAAADAPPPEPAP